MMSKIKTWFLALPNHVRAGINTAWQSALGSFALALLGFLTDVQEWFGDTGGDFPAVTPLGKGAGPTAVGLAVGVLTALFRWVKPGPTYPKQ